MINIVDLAGSERGVLRNNNNVNDALSREMLRKTHNESGFINKSLLL